MPKPYVTRNPIKPRGWTARSPKTRNLRGGVSVRVKRRFVTKALDAISRGQRTIFWN